MGRQLGVPHFIQEFNRLLRLFSPAFIFLDGGASISPTVLTQSSPQAAKPEYVDETTGPLGF
jgi:hypothetical protein